MKTKPTECNGEFLLSLSAETVQDAAMLVRAGGSTKELYAYAFDDGSLFGEIIMKAKRGRTLHEVKK